MNEKAQELNAEEREALAKLIAMDPNDMRDTHIEAIRARADYLTDETKARFDFLIVPKKPSKSARLVQDASIPKE
jgi:inorganic pyrophosphatase